MSDNAQLVKRVALDGVIVAGLLALINRVRSMRHVPPLEPQATPPADIEKLPPSKSYAVVLNPAENFKPCNPPWMTEAVQRAEGALTNGAEELPECPALANFVDKVQQLGFDVEPGRAARKVLFALDPNVRYLNHGSYGATFKLALLVQAWYREVFEQQCVRFMETRALQGLTAAREDLATLVGAEARDIVTMVNATQAVNTVMASTPLRPGDMLLITSLTYPAIRHTCARAAGRAGADLIEVQLPLAVVQDEAAILRAFEDTFRAGGRRIRLAVIDHVSSFPPVLFPVQQICALCRQHDVKVLVDGAHAVGALPLDLPSLGAHFYTSNLHKWLCTPKGTAFLWVQRSEQAGLTPLATSHGYGMGFQGEFLWNGTSDPTGWLAVPAALAVFKALKPATIRQHNHRLLLQALQLLQKAWGTRLAIGAGAPFSCMTAIELPAMGKYPVSGAGAAAIHNQLRNLQDIEVPCACWEGKLWVRISAQLYNTLDEYEALAQAILDLAAELTDR